MSDYVIRGAVVDDHVRIGVAEYFWQTADRFGDRICQIDADSNRKETFAQVRTRALRVAVQLRKMGVKPKDVVMVSCEKDVDLIVALLAALSLGAYVLCTVPYLVIVDIEHAINEVKPNFIFATEKLLSNIEEALKSLDLKIQMCVIGQSSIYPSMIEMEGIRTDEEETFRPVQVDVHDTATILFTSGTTSSPKGVRISHLSLLAAPCRSNPDQLYFFDTPMVFSNLYWISGQLVTMFNIIFAQPRIVALQISAEKFLELVDQYKVQHAFLIYVRVIELATIDDEIWKKYDRSSMLVLTTGGMLIDLRHMQKLGEIFPNAVVRQNYSATEMGNVALCWDPANRDMSETTLRSMGKVAVNTEIKVVDVTTRGALGPNSHGEILVKSPYLMLGFTGDRDTTSLFDDEGFYKSGDIGYYDEQGYFFFVERKSDVFRFRTSNIYPNMVEDALKSHSAVDQAVVFDLPHEIDFNRIVACLTVKKNSRVSEQEISDHVANKMDELYRPIGGVRILSEMPITATGKIARNEVRNLFNQFSL